MMWYGSSKRGGGERKIADRIFIRMKKDLFWLIESVQQIFLQKFHGSVKLKILVGLFAEAVSFVLA